MTERKNAVTFKGKGLTLVGESPKVGGSAVDFEIVDVNLKRFSLKDFEGKTLVCITVPSLDTPTCDTEAKKFNEKVAGLGGDIRVLVISMDLPFAQKRWCQASNVQNVVTCSDHRQASFGLAYGVLIKELRLLARAIFIIDKKGKLRYVQVVNEITQEPNYDEVFKTVAGL